MKTEINNTQWGPTEFEPEISAEVAHQEPAINNYPFELLPPELREYASEIHRVTGAPLELSVGTCIAFCSAAMGLGVQIQNAYKGNNGLGILQFVFSLESGSGKSTLLNLIRRPLDAWIKKREEHFRSFELPKLLAEKDLLEKEHKDRINASKKGDRDVHSEEIRTIREKLEEINNLLSQPQFTTEDCTLSAMAHLLWQNGKTGQEAVFSISPDARPAIRTLLGAWSKKGNVEDNLLVKGYSGDPHQQDRRGQSGSCRIKRACVNLLFFIQPDVLREILANPEMMHSGFVQRVMFSEIEWPLSHYNNPEPVDKTADQWWENCITRILETYRISSEPQFFRPEDEAKRLIVSYHDENVDAVKDGTYADVQSHVVRWHEWAYRFSLVLAVLEHDGIGERAVTKEHAQTGVALAKYYAAEKMALIDQSREAARDALKQRLCELIKASDAGLSVRQMQRQLRTYSATSIRNALKDIPEATPHQNHPAEGGWPQVTYFWDAKA